MYITNIPGLIFILFFWTILVGVLCFGAGAEHEIEKKHKKVICPNLKQNR